MMNREARLDFEKLDTPLKAAFQEEKARLKALSETPGVKPLKNRWRGYFRLVLRENWRILFRIVPGIQDPHHITVVRIRHRSVAYD